MDIIIHQPSGQHICHNKTDFEAFTSGLTFVPAAGGMVMTAEGLLLMIFRRGSWDLPKGKVDPGESIEACAIREVQEETGIMNLEIKQKLQTTYHTYQVGAETIIKPSHWFLMHSYGNETPIPQLEEDITEIVWKNKKSVEKILNNTYASIRELIVNHYL